MAPQPSGNNGNSVLWTGTEDLQKPGDLGVYHRRVDSVSGFVLAGGKSSRMGQDKAFLELGGRTLLAQALEKVRAVTANTWIVGSAAKFAGFGPVVEDVFPACGPLGGIQAALTATSTDLNLVTAVDMPFLQLDFLNYLIARARASNAVVVVPRAGGGLQPLCAIYRKKFVEVAQRSLRAGNNKVGSLFAEVHTLVVEESELQQSGFAEEMFRNLNTEPEWQEAKQKLSAGDQKHL
ncbi:MAG: molybdenum cofactor guanylyltransferase [Terriglobales bacterium]